MFFLKWRMLSSNLLLKGFLFFFFKSKTECWILSNYSIPIGTIMWLLTFCSLKISILGILAGHLLGLIDFTARAKIWFLVEELDTTKRLYSFLKLYVSSQHLLPKQFKVASKALARSEIRSAFRPRLISTRNGVPCITHV